MFTVLDHGTINKAVPASGSHFCLTSNGEKRFPATVTEVGDEQPPFLTSTPAPGVLWCAGISQRPGEADTAVVPESQIQGLSVLYNKNLHPPHPLALHQGSGID